MSIYIHNRGQFRYFMWGMIFFPMLCYLYIVLIFQEGKFIQQPSSGEGQNSLHAVSWALKTFLQVATTEKLKNTVHHKVVLGYQSSSALNTNNRPCETDEAYSFPRCLDMYFSNRYEVFDSVEWWGKKRSYDLFYSRGCQPPWHSYPSNATMLPECNGSSEFRKMLLEEEEGGGVKDGTYIHCYMWHEQ